LRPQDDGSGDGDFIAFGVRCGGNPSVVASPRFYRRVRTPQEKYHHETAWGDESKRILQLTESASVVHSHRTTQVISEKNF
jgi:hypothetical protein